jgi:hypothetical protein
VLYALKPAAQVLCELQGSTRQTAGVGIASGCGTLTQCELTLQHYWAADAQHMLEVQILQRQVFDLIERPVADMLKSTLCHTFRLPPASPFTATVQLLRIGGMAGCALCWSKTVSLPLIGDGAVAVRATGAGRDDIFRRAFFDAEQAVRQRRTRCGGTHLNRSVSQAQQPR